MELGVCLGGPDVALPAVAGLHFVEYAAARVLDPNVSDKEWAAVRDRILAGPLPVPVCNLFFPPDMPLVGPQRDPSRAATHAEKIFDRLASIGARVQVFGSGGARRAPDGYPREQALDELKELLGRLGPMAEARSVVIAMEPLRSKETNLLNSLAETLALVRELNQPAVRLLADSFHMDQMDEPYDVIGGCRAWIAHVHVADGATRHEPAAGDTDLRPFLAALKTAGYDGRISLECAWQDFQKNLGPSLERLRTQWAEA